MSLLNSIKLFHDAKIAALAMFLLLSACASTPEADVSGSETISGAGVKTEPVDTDKPRVVPSGAATLYEEALASMAAADWSDAERRFNNFLRQYPDFPGAHINLAIILADRDDLQSAVDSVNNALRIDPGHARALNQLGMLLRRQGKFTEAESAYLLAVDSDPDYALAHHNLGVLNDLYLRRLEIALEHYEQFQELAGKDREVSKWITDLQRRIGRRQSTARLSE